MKRIAVFLFISLLFLCCENKKQNDDKRSIKFDSIQTVFADTTTTLSEVKPIIQFSKLQLESFLDSIGNLKDTTQLAEKVAFTADSIFENQLQINRLLSNEDFNKLKLAIKTKEIDKPTAIKVFGNVQVDSSFLESGKIPITLISFDKNKKDLNEFAICLGYPDAAWSCELYFFKQNRIIAKHIINHHYGLIIKQYKDIDGKTIIYYKENFGTGTGIWQFNLFFYKYFDDKLIPVLNELENGNQQIDWGPRAFWFKTKIIKTTPLTLKMVNYQEFYDSIGNAYKIINDSTYVKYLWDEKSKTLVGNYSNSKINKSQILSYYLGNNEIQFANAYYKTLKASLLNKKKKKYTLDYLNQVKNHFENL